MSTGNSKPATIVLGPGVYPLGDLGRLVLTSEDSSTAWIAPYGEAALIGVVTLRDLNWNIFSESIWSAKIQQPLPSGTTITGLFTSDNRMLIRSRHPIGDPTQMNGLCFLGGNLREESCNAYMKPDGTAPNTQFIGKTIRQITFNTTRGGSVAGDNIYRMYDILFQAPPENLAADGFPAAICNQGEGGGELFIFVIGLSNFSGNV